MSIALTLMRTPFFADALTWEVVWADCSQQQKWVHVYLSYTIAFLYTVVIVNWHDWQCALLFHYVVVMIVASSSWRSWTSFQYGQQRGSSHKLMFANLGRNVCSAYLRGELPTSRVHWQVCTPHFCVVGVATMFEVLRRNCHRLLYQVDAVMQLSFPSHEACAFELHCSPSPIAVTDLEWYWRSGCEWGKYLVIHVYMDVYVIIVDLFHCTAVDNSKTMFTMPGCPQHLRGMRGVLHWIARLT